MHHKLNKSNSIATININNKKLDSLMSLLTLESWRNPKPVISVLKLYGVIGNVGLGRKGMTLDALNNSIESAFNKPNLAAVCLAINSPGGSPVQSEMIASKITNLAKEKNVQVYSFVEDMAASGGYWLACAADEIYASKSSILGSIGVISSGFGFQDLISKIGVERRVYTQGANKSILDPFKPEKKSDIDILLKAQKHTHDNFTDYVKLRRKGRLTQNDDLLFNGEFWSGQTAFDYGIIDGIDHMHNFIKKKFGNNAKVDYITPKESWFKKKFLSSIDADSLVDALYDKITQEEITSKFRMF
ncbi:MAG: hypothetical protein RLZZ59_366 [Pseudomonadota bacterium]|jgi:signal peptide peptidase SppA